MKTKHFIFLLLFVSVSIARGQGDVNKFEQFARHQDSLLIDALRHRDINVYGKRMNDFLVQYNLLSPGNKEKFVYHVFNAYYNFACIYSVTGNKTMALVWLKKSVDAGFNDFSNFAADPDLENIRYEKEFENIRDVLRNNLVQKLKKTTTDSLKIGVLSELVIWYRDVNDDSMVFYSQQMVLLTKEGKTVAAWQHGDALMSLGVALWYAANYPDAKDALLKGLGKAETSHDTSQMMITYFYLAKVSSNAGDFRQAINYLNKSESLAKYFQDETYLIRIPTDRGKVYEQLGVLDSAFVDEQQALALIYKKYHGEKNGLDGHPQQNMARIYSKMGNKKLAEEFFRQSFAMNFEINRKLLLANGYCSFAEHFDRFNQRDSAIYYATKASGISSKYHLNVQQLEADILLTKLYRAAHNIDSAFKYQTLMIETRDKIFSTEKITRLHTLEFNEQLRQQEIATEKQSMDDKRKQDIQYALIALGLVSFIILFLLLSRSSPFLERITHHTPVFMLLALVCIAAILVPLHHKLQKWATNKLVEKNKTIRLAHAKKTIEKLTADSDKSSS